VVGPCLVLTLTYLFFQVLFLVRFYIQQLTPRIMLPVQLWTWHDFVVRHFAAI